MNDPKDNIILIVFLDILYSSENIVTDFYFQQKKIITNDMDIPEVFHSPHEEPQAINSVAPDAYVFPTTDRNPYATETGHIIHSISAIRLFPNEEN